MTLCDFIYELTEHLHAVDRSQLVCIITLSLLLAVLCDCACMCACVGACGGGMRGDCALLSFAFHNVIRYPCVVRECSWADELL